MEIRDIEPYVSEFLSSVYRSFSKSQAQFIARSRHSHACKICGSHPVNSVRREKVICRTCGTSYRDTVKNDNGDSHKDTVLLDLRKKV